MCVIDLKKAYKQVVPQGENPVFVVARYQSCCSSEEMSELMRLSSPNLSGSNVPTIIMIPSNKECKSVGLCVESYLEQLPLRTPNGKVYLDIADSNALRVLCNEPMLGYVRSFAEIASDPNSRLYLFVTLHGGILKHIPRKFLIPGTAQQQRKELCGAAVVRYFEGHPLPLEIEYFGLAGPWRGRGIGKQLYYRIHHVLVSMLATDLLLEAPFKIGLQACYTTEPGTQKPNLRSGPPKFWTSVGFNHHKAVELGPGQPLMLIMWVCVK